MKNKKEWKEAREDERINTIKQNGFLPLQQGQYIL